jgi:hypothetical protein
MALACAEARAADFSDAASDQQYIEAPKGSAIGFDREGQAGHFAQVARSPIRALRMVGLPSFGTHLSRSALFVNDLDLLGDHQAGEAINRRVPRRSLAQADLIRRSFSEGACTYVGGLAIRYEPSATQELPQAAHRAHPTLPLALRSRPSVMRAHAEA